MSPGLPAQRLACPVRGCLQPLGYAPEGRGRVFCGRGHSFDRARSGYYNLLQPQDRRSKSPGDSKTATEARRRLHRRGFTQPLLDALSAFAAIEPGASALDVGCGDGFYLGALVEALGLEGHGVDISLPAIEAASKRYPAAQWVVANADRTLPYQTQAFDRVLSINARMNPSEFQRVLRPAASGARLLVVLPAADDLCELRGSGRIDRVERTVTEFAPHFELAERRYVGHSACLDAEAIDDVRLAIYRPGDPESSVIEPNIGSRSVRFAWDLLLFRPLAMEEVPGTFASE
ncbi:MAG: methyltransferase domain-containing protein [Planctomycetes bacterium]|nr:methyltransferase domain-containing protein [Planctomycetota bacterium]MCB9909609.1 methyltransferase domain-containing protein [Planctomycetota bacterium]MCB9911902.1 methyltransferase domain-containing protein [Planctomycetota bacterium]HPF14463.1 methyltransferase domain-containing protein [Planctomycetota bacterium]HRV80836.1 methyltransferase domain-containing protein [Planctomycetota bacterium]